MAERRTRIAKISFALVAVALVAGIFTGVAQAAVKKEIDIKLSAKERAKFYAEHLMNLVEQAMDWNLSDEMIEEIMNLFKVRYKGYWKLPQHTVFDSSAFNRLVTDREKFARQLQNELTARHDAIFKGDKGGISKDKTDENVTILEPGGGTMDMDGLEGAGEKEIRGMIEKGQIDPALGAELIKLKRKGTSIPLKEARRLEGLINNAILEALKGKDYEIAALGVYLHSSNEVKVILIVTSSNMPRSRIRVTLRDIRGIIETEVLKAKFPQFKLAQLSSFTILNEVENHFYEHAVLYWQMQLPGWQVPVKEIPISRPVTIDRRATVTPTKERPSVLGHETTIEKPADMEFDESDFLDIEGSL